jgi:hypothetical protein
MFPLFSDIFLSPLFPAFEDDCCKESRVREESRKGDCFHPRNVILLDFLAWSEHFTWDALLGGISSTFPLSDDRTDADDITEPGDRLKQLMMT